MSLTCQYVNLLLQKFDVILDMSSILFCKLIINYTAPDRIHLGHNPHTSTPNMTSASIYLYVDGAEVHFFSTANSRRMLVLNQNEY